jgi:uncharacterized protein (DUF362 family)
VDRRQFLSSSARVFGAGVFLPWTRVWAEGAAADGQAPASDSFPDLVVARGGAKVATERALAAIGGMERFVQPGQVVVVKPNASFQTVPDMGATTHPEVLAAVLAACLEAGARRVLVVDHTMRKPERCFERTGTADTVAGFKGAKLVALDDPKHFREVEVEAGSALRKTEIAAVIQKADVFINLPTAKSHAATGVSFGFKNLMGLVWDRTRFHNDLDLHAGIADLGTVLRPQLTILDAVRILKTGGPTGPGDVQALDSVVAGVDPVAVDAYAVGLSAWNGQTYRPEQVAHLRHAASHGLGTLDLDTLRVQEVG